MNQYDAPEWSWEEAPHTERPEDSAANMDSLAASLPAPLDCEDVEAMMFDTPKPFKLYPEFERLTQWRQVGTEERVAVVG